MRTIFRRFMVRNFVGLEGFQIVLLGKDGKLKDPVTVSWLKCGPRLMFLWIIYGSFHVLMVSCFKYSAWDFHWYNLFALLFFFISVYGGIIYPKMYPLAPDELNDIEKHQPPFL